MEEQNIKEFSKWITKVIQKEDLSRSEAYQAFKIMLNDETTDMQQGAFLAALASKGETKEEIAACWEAIYKYDTVRVANHLGKELIDNCGTGMDSFKTFNISTCASIIAAAGGIPVARHGARALTSICGTVDIAEALGVDVNCNVDIAMNSLQESNLALFNGMSPSVHPNALGRILSQISFGSILNIAASLASPVKPAYGVRGVYSKQIIRPVVAVMKEIGYKRALVFNGQIDNNELSMDEASICGITYCAELKEDGSISEFSFRPEEMGLNTCSSETLKPLAGIENECKSIINILQEKENEARLGAVLLNTGLIYYISGKAESIKNGVSQAKKSISEGIALSTLENWVRYQNENPDQGLQKLQTLSKN